MKNVLVLTDFSNASENALYYAVQYFENESCNFYVMHINDAKSFTTDDLMIAGNKSLYDSLISSSTKKLKTLTSSIKKQFPLEDHNYIEITDYDSFIDSVNQAIKSKSIDLIVMGSNGVSDAKEALFGTNTLNIVRQINCPTLIVPETHLFSTSKHVLIPVDDKEFSISKELIKTLSQVQFNNSIIHVLLIDVNENDQNIIQINKDLSDKQIEYHSVKNIPTHFAINSFIQTNNIDLLLLKVKDDFFLDRIFKGSSSTRVSREPIIPILVIH